MKFEQKSPPRTFTVGHGSVITIEDHGRIALDPEEQVTFVTEAGAEYDVARKSWGFYATPSLNSRLSRFGLRAALAKSWENKYFVYLVERGQEADFQRYLDSERNHVVCWLDTDEALAAVERAVVGAP